MSMSTILLLSEDQLANLARETIVEEEHHHHSWRQVLLDSRNRDDLETLDQ